MPEDTDRNRRVVERFDALLGRTDLIELDELCTPDMVNHALAGDRPAGLAGTREFLMTAAASFGADGWEDDLVVLADGDYVVQIGTRSGTWAGGSFLGHDVNPGPYRRQVAFVYRLKDGRIAERWAIRDDLTMLRQLGGLGGPPPPA